MTTAPLAPSDLWMMSYITADWSFAALLWPQLLRGFAMMLCIVPSVGLALNGFAGPQLRYASGLFNLMRNLGGAVGIAVVSVWLSDQTRIHAERFGEAMSRPAGAAGGLRWRLFDFGRVDAEVANARGREAEALAAYRAAVYRATGEVETALSNLVQSRAQVAALRSEIAELTRARDQAETAYEGGAVSLIEVLDADRDLLAASDQLAQARSGAALAAVASFRAAGAG